MSQTGRDWKKMWSIATFYLWLALLLFPDSFPRGQCLSVSNDIFRVTLKTCEWTIQKVSRVNDIVIGMKWNKECIAGEKYPVVPSPLGGVTILWLKCLYHFDTLLVLWYTAWTTLIHCLLVSFDAGNFLKAYCAWSLKDFTLTAKMCKLMSGDGSITSNALQSVSKTVATLTSFVFLMWKRIFVLAFGII